MVVSFVSIPELSFGKVQFISAKLGGNELSEFEKFDEKEFTQQQHLKERQLIYTTIETMGRRGAKIFYFRPEGPAFALPGRVDQHIIESNPGDFGLRLYCGFLRSDLVLLLNGDIKTKLKPEDCPNVRGHFKNAVRLMNVLLKAQKDGFVRFTRYGIEKIYDEYDIEI